LVRQVSPTCRIAGRFSLQGHAGLNRIRFPGRPSRWQLDAGTYRISARTPAGRLLRRVTLLVVKAGAPTSDEISSARAANVCSSASRVASAESTGASNTSLPGGQQQLANSFIPKSQPSASGPAPVANAHSGAVLGSTVARATRAIQPLLIALLALAIVLLGLASLPRTVLAESRANDLLARHRPELAGLGAVALVAVAIAFLAS
jgi:hypothetical protein